MVPSNPGEAASIRRERRRGEEVVAFGEDPGRSPAVRREHNKVVVHLAILVALPNADEMTAVGGHDGVGVAPGPFAWRFKGDRHGRVARSQPVKALVREVREIRHAVVHHCAPPAVLVRERAYREPVGHDVLDVPSGAAAHEHVAATLARTALHPIDRVTVSRGRAQGHGIGCEELGGDRRRPRAVGSELSGHRAKMLEGSARFHMDPQRSPLFANVQVGRIRKQGVVASSPIVIVSTPL
jgi:hypothetical protein